MSFMELPDSRNQSDDVLNDFTIAVRKIVKKYSCGVHYDALYRRIKLYRWLDPQRDDPGSGLDEQEVALFENVSSAVITTSDTVTVGVMTSFEVCRSEGHKRCRIVLEDNDGSLNEVSFTFASEQITFLS